MKNRPEPEVFESPAQRLPCALRCISAAVALACANSALSNPTAPSVAAGAASFQTSGSTLTVTNAPGTIINWSGFSIGAGETTRFLQQSAASAVLNRVIGSDPSSLLGTLTSNGRVFLINPNGIVVGAGARIDTAGFIASTLNMTDANFLNGRMSFEGGGFGVVRNEGTIRASGDIMLVGPRVENAGLIHSDNGSVLLAAGQKLTITSPDAQGVKFELQAPSDSALNVGAIEARNAVTMFAGTLRHSGDIRAGLATADDSGRVLLKAQGDAIVDGNATITASGAKGGEVQILGDRVGIFGSAAVDASGERGGGTILVGGDYQGKNPDVQNAMHTVIAPDVTLKADAIASGDGGKVIVWSDDLARFYGSISARGGAASGNGGFVETSGKERLDVVGAKVDARAPAGQAGTWLLDPKDVTVAAGGSALLTDVDNFADPGTSVTVSPATLGSSGAAVTIEASNNVTFVDPTAMTQNLTVKAGNSIFVNNNVTTAGAAISMTANDATATGARDPGQAALAMQNGRLIQAGNTVNLTMDGGPGAGDITVSNVTAPVISVTNNNPNQKILRTTASLLSSTTGVTLVGGAVGAPGAAGRIRVAPGGGTVTATSTSVDPNPAAGGIFVTQTSGMDLNRYTLTMPGPYAVELDSQGSVNFTKGLSLPNASVTLISGDNTVNSVLFVAGAPMNIDVASLTIDMPAGGAAQMNQGTINFNGALTVNGIFANQSNATANLNGSTTFNGPLTLDTGVNPFGTINANAPVNVVGDFTLAKGTLGGTGTLTLNGATNVWSGGSMVGSGSTVVPATKALAVNGAGVKTSTRGFTNDGAVNVNGGTLELGGEGTDTGTYALGTNTLRTSGGSRDFSAATFTGAGTLEVSGGTTTLPAAVTGALTIDGGTATSSAGTTVADTFTLSAGELAGTGAITLNGSANTFSGGQITNNAGVTAPSLTWTNGQIGPGGKLVLNGAGTYLVAGGSPAINSGGTLELSGTGDLVINNEATFTNAGTFDIQSNRGITQTAGLPATLVNAQFATLRKSVATGTSVIGNGGLTLSNTGRIEVQAGTLTTALNTFGTNGGTIEVSSGATFRNDNPSFTNFVDIQGTGTVDVAGILTNSGTLRPGNFGNGIGTLTIKGTLQQDAGGAINVGISGTNAGEFGQIAVTGNATLNGTLNVNHLDAFAPPSNSSFPIIIATGVITGDFSSKNFPAGYAEFYTPTPGNPYVLNLGNVINRWNVGTGGLWEDQQSWSLLHTPTAGEDAEIADIGNAGPTHTITVSDADQRARKLTSAENISIVAGGNLTLGPLASTVTASIDVTGGTLVAGGPLTANAINVSSGTLNATGGSLSRLALSGTGALAKTTPGDLTINGPVNISGGQIFQFSNGKLVTSGTTTVTSTVDVFGDWTNNGVVNLNSGSIALNAGSPVTFTNAVGATLNLATPNLTDTQPFGTATNAIINNAGAINKTAAAPMDLVQTFNNQTGGTVNITNGNLTLSGDGQHGGAFDVSSGAALTFGGSGVINTLQSASTITGAGRVVLASGTLDVQKGSLPKLEQTGGTLTRVGVGDVTITGAYKADGGTVLLAGDLVTSGTTDVDPATAVTVDVTNWRNSGTLNINTGQLAPVAASNVAFVNTGTVNVSTADSNPLGTAATATFTNKASATFNMSSTAASFPGAFTNEANATLNVNSGTLTLPALTQAGNVRMNSGATLATGGALTNLASGTIGGSGTVDVGAGNSLINVGKLQPGGTTTSNATPGTLFITGGLIQDPNGEIDIKIGSPTASDSVAVSGTAGLAGKVNLSTIGGFTPAQNDAYTVVNAAQVIGQFGSFTKTFANEVFPSYVAAPGAATMTIGSAGNNTWLLNISGFWDNPLAWSQQHVPLVGENVIVSKLVPGLVVTVPAGSFSGSSLTSNEPLTVAGTLTLANASTISAGVTLFGTLQGVVGAPAVPVTVSGPLAMTGGTIGSRAIVTADSVGVQTLQSNVAGTLSTQSLAVNSGALSVTGTLNLTGGGTKTVSGGTVSNAGTLNLGGTSNLVLNNGVTLTNLAAGTFNIAGNIGVQSTAGTTPTFDNAGTLAKTAGGSGTSTIGISNPVNFTNTGTLDAQTGTLEFSGNNTFNGATLFNGAGTNLVTTNSTFNGTMNPLSSNLTLQSGNFGGSGNLAGTTTWTGGAITGTLTVPANGTLNLAGGGGKTVNGGTLTNAGTINVVGAGNLLLENGATLTNNAMLDFQSDAGVQFTFGAPPTLTNAGTLRKSAGTGTSAIGISNPIAFSNTGTLNAQTGTLQYQSNNAFNAGTAFTGAGTNLVTTDSTFTGTSTSTNLTLQSGNFSGTGSLAGTTAWTGGSITGTLTVPNGATVNLTGAAGKTVNGGTLTNAGTINVVGSGNLLLENAATLTNNATLDFQSDAGVQYTTGAIPTLTNSASGTLTKSAGTTSVIGISNPITFINNGTLTPAANTTLQYASNNTFNDGTSFTGAGVNAVTSSSAFNGTISSANLSLDGGDYSGSPTLSGATNWTAGRFLGTVTLPSRSALNVTGAGAKSIDGAAAKLTSAGIVNLTDSAVTIANGGQWDNTGTMNLSGASSVVLNGAGASTFTNSATLNDSSTSATLFAQGPVAGTGGVTNAGTLNKNTGSNANQAIDVPFSNSGNVTLAANTGTLKLTQGGTDSGAYSVASGATVELAGGTRTLGAASNVSGAGSVLVSGGTTNVSGAYTPAVTTIAGGAANFNGVESTGTLNLTGGTLAGTGNITMTTGGTWSGGTLSGTETLTVASGAALNLTGAGAKVVDGATLANAGTTNVVGAGNVVLNNGATLNNTGTLDLQADANIVRTAAAGATPTLVNSGTIMKTGGTASTIGGGAALASTSNGGTFDVRAGTLTHAATNTFNDGTKFIGAGASVVASDSTLNGAISSANLELRSGDYAGAPTISGTTSWTGGKFTGTPTIAATGTLNVTGGAAKSIDGAAAKLTSAGTVNVTDAAVTIANGAQWDNAGIVNLAGAANVVLNGPGASSLLNRAGATINDSSTNASLASQGPVAGTGAFTNAGTFNRNAGSNANQTIDVAFNNTGSVNLAANTGTLKVTQDGTDTGAYIIAAGTTLEIGGGSRQLAAGSSFSGAGALALSGGTLGVAGALSIPVTFNISGGSISGGGTSFTTAGTTTITGDVTLARNWTNTGTLNMTGGEINASVAGVTFTNANLMTITTSDTTPFDTVGTAQIVNTGVMNIGGATAFAYDFKNPFTNAAGATLNVNAGSLTLPATLTNAGTVRLAAGTTLFTAGGNLTNALGATVGGTGSLNVGAGTFINAGLLEPGVGPTSAAVGTLAVIGNFTQTPTGQLNIRLGGAGAGLFDTVAVTGTATLGGTLNLTTVGGFTPAIGTAFNVVTYGARVGDFAVVNAPATPLFTTAPLPASYQVAAAVPPVIPVTTTTLTDISTSSLLTLNKNVIILIVTDPTQTTTNEKRTIGACS